MTISVRLSDKDTELIKAYAEMNNISLSDLVRNAVMEKIEDEYDLECYKKAMKEYKKNPENYKGSVAHACEVIRVSVTNRTMTPDLYEILKLLGKDRIKERISKF